MTHEQNERSAQLPAINAPSAESIEPFDDEQHAPLDSPTMSTHGLFTSYLASEHRLSGDWLVQPDQDEGEVVEEEEMEGEGEEEEEEVVVVVAAAVEEDDNDNDDDDDDDDEGHRCTSDRPSVWSELAMEQASLHGQQTPQIPPSAGAGVSATTVFSRASQTLPEGSNDSERPRKRARITFYDFAAQAQLQQHHERRKHHLAARKRSLQRSIALAARLKRASSWVQDGLVEISKHQDSVGFVRVFSHANDLVDACYSHWNNELQHLDILHGAHKDTLQPSTTPAFFDQLPLQAQSDLLNLLSDLRSNPRFLIDRLSNLPFSQVATLTAKPKWEASETLLASLSQQSGNSAQRRRRVQAFSKELEDYAMSFERSDPFSLMLHNIYSHDALPDSPENQLRLWTWSSVCAELLQTQSESYGSLYWQALEAFSDMQEWPAKTRVELFLMDILQRGAFLIKEGSSQRGKSSTDHLNTKQAHDFFESAVFDLYWTLIHCKTGCYPTGALALAQAILGKLPNETYQSEFRTHFFQHWFLNHFLKTAIMYPENENMLLKIHVSRRARECVLAPLFNRFAAKFESFMDPDTDENIQNIILDMISMLEGTETSNPYANTTTTTSSSSPGATESGLQPTGPPMLVICASECVKILETLSPQAMYSAHYLSDGVMRGIGHAFQATYSLPSTRFDMLKQALLQLIEPGTSAKDIHPCLEAWTEFRIDRHGRVMRPEALVEENCVEALQHDAQLLVSQRAALRLCVGGSGKQTGAGTAVVSAWTPSTMLADIFESQAAHSQAATDMVDFVFWKQATADLRAQNPLMLATDDSILLRRPLRQLQATKEADMIRCDALEAQLGPFEGTYKTFKRHIKDFAASLEGLRLKLWYTSEVVNSRRYVDARNIALALSHMNILHLRMTTSNEPPSRSYMRPTSSRSTASSIFGNLRDDAMEILKAPTEHGGPRKLADPQIESIKQWFQQHNVDNFCKGEERLHRFCMEIWQVSRTLTGETMIDSEELWASDLFTRERASYDISAFGVNSAPASTRPASVFSETFSTSAPFHGLRPSLRSVDSDARSTTSDERSSIRRGSVYGLFQGRLNPQLLTPSLASSMGSYGRASSATTTASDIFSLPSQSVTSASVYSRPPSILHGGLPNFASRPVASTRGKKEFRDKLRTGLVCLLLSDLGSLVWSWGCETDTWIQSVQAAKTVMARLDKRLGMESMRQHKDNGPARMIRRQSETEACSGTLSQLDETPHMLQEQQADSEPVDYVEALRDTLIRMSQHLDPLGKLQACLDFDSLALEQLSKSDETTSPLMTRAPQHHVMRRRNSDTPLTGHSMDSRARATTRPSPGDHREATEKRTIHHYKRQLALLRPETIFRDLQYIAVFTPQEMLDKTPAGKAFMRLGVAALEYKRDLCSSMVDVANQIVAADGIKRRRSISKPELPLAKAAEYWKIAALEGNREAQRELALLYLMHPAILSVVTSPLITSSTIFRDDMMWQKQVGNNTSRQALCLALHWMQQAARAGDSIAQQKLQEREGGLSIR